MKCIWNLRSQAVFVFLFFKMNLAPRGLWRSCIGFPVWNHTAEASFKSQSQIIFKSKFPLVLTWYCLASAPPCQYFYPFQPFTTQVSLSQSLLLCPFVPVCPCFLKDVHVLYVWKMERWGEKNRAFLCFLCPRMPCAPSKNAILLSLSDCASCLLLMLSPSFSPLSQ